MKFTKIPETAFQKLQMNAGVVLSDFDPAAAAVVNESILGATTGGLSFSAVPTFSDFGEDIDNCPKNMKELKKLESWEITLGGTFVTVDAAGVKRMLSAADLDASNAAKIVPRNDLRDTDFEDLWWVGDYSDENGEDTGGFVAIHMMNTLSTGGLSIQSTDRGKGTFAFTFTAHYSMNAQDVVPFEVYVSPGVAA